MLIVEWCLGIDVPVIYKAKFSIRNRTEKVVFKGWQEKTDQSTIRYSIVKKNRLGIPSYYESIEIPVNYSENGNWFQHTFTNLPQDHGYEVEIYNYGQCLCKGGFTIEIHTTKNE